MGGATTSPQNNARKRNGGVRTTQRHHTQRPDLAIYPESVDFIGLAPRHFDAALGGILTAAMNAHGWNVNKVAVFARLRPRDVRRILAGRTSAGTVQLRRLLLALQLDHDVTIRAAYVEAHVAQLAADTEAAEHDARTRSVFG